MLRKLIASLLAGWLLISFLIMELQNTTIAIFLLICMGAVTFFVIGWIIEGGLNSIIDIITPPRCKPDQKPPVKPKDDEPKPDMWYVMRPEQLE